MDVTLALITVFSLALAATMSVVAWRLSRDERGAGRPVEAADGLLAPADERGRGARMGTALAAGVFVAGSATALAVALGGGRGLDPRGRVRAAAGDAPLELLSLTEDREADRIVVRGVVRNPASGGELDRLAAVVLLVGEDGAVLGRARAPVAAALGPGEQSPFQVSAPGGDGAVRYRISFAAGDRIVPHVDRRDRVVARREVP